MDAVILNHVRSTVNTHRVRNPKQATVNRAMSSLIERNLRSACQLSKNLEPSHLCTDSTRQMQPHGTAQDNPRNRRGGVLLGVTLNLPFTACSVRPGISLAIAAHLVPRRFCVAQRSPRGTRGNALSSLQLGKTRYALTRTTVLQRFMFYLNASTRSRNTTVTTRTTTEAPPKQP